MEPVAHCLWMSLCICEEGGIQRPRLAGVSCVQAGVDLRQQMERIPTTTPYALPKDINNPCNPDRDAPLPASQAQCSNVAAHGGPYKVSSPPHQQLAV